mmetsp:Transcript_12658/g.38094  ORF Transcript_12658/g.38094 Transcript_12658/m.38094 type:complete len:221 (-) Transcript_12658:65-727(-)
MLPMLVGPQKYYLALTRGNVLMLRQCAINFLMTSLARMNLITSRGLRCLLDPCFSSTSELFTVEVRTRLKRQVVAFFQDQSCTRARWSQAPPRGTFLIIRRFLPMQYDLSGLRGVTFATGAHECNYVTAYPGKKAIVARSRFALVLPSYYDVRRLDGLRIRLSIPATHCEERARTSDTSRCIFNFQVMVSCWRPVTCYYRVAYRVRTVLRRVPLPYACYC